MKLLKAILLSTALIATGVNAETVYVKYRGNVDIAGYACTVPSSSFVYRICYKASDKYLVVQLRDTYYHYCRIPASTVSAWKSASSVGDYYNQNIKGNFDCRQGGISQ